ncbi:MAG TPA: SpoIIE family protein phosphatase [Nannocystis sp.]
MKLRTTLLLGMLALVAALVAATVLVLSVVLEREARRQIVGDLERAEAVFADLHALRQSLYRSESLTVAQEPRLKAVLGTSDIDRATIVDVATEMQKAGGADLFLLTDGAGRLIVDTAEPNTQNVELGELPLVRAALADGDAGGVWTQAQRVFQVHARRLAFGDEVVGALVLGHRLDERVIRTVQRQTGSGVVLVLDGVAVDHALADPALAAAVAPLASELGDGVHERTLLDDRYLVRRARLPGYAGDRALGVVFIESLDDALATSRALTRWISVLAALALVLAAGLAWAIARRLSRPVVELVEFTRNIAAGALEARAPLRGPVEVQALAAAMNHMAGDLAAARLDLAAKERLEQELEIARRIQTSILPRHIIAPGMQLDARMRPASEVGGDYYDILPVVDGCWLGIGDVAGHGLTAGLVMLMVQSLIAMLVQERPGARPSELLPALNMMLYKNIRERLSQDEHVTLTLLRVLADGQVYFAGAHEDIVVCRAASGRCERIETPGTWLGVVAEIGPPGPDGQLRLAPGDLMLLYTDGVTEAMSTRREQFGMDRLCAALEQVRERPVGEICDHLMGVVAGWTAVQRDDVTLLVLRHTGA